MPGRPVPPLSAAALAAALAWTCAPDTRLHDVGGRAGTPARTPEVPQGPPEVISVALGVAAGCVRVRAEANQPVDASVHMIAAGRAELWPLGQGASLFDQVFRLPGWPSGQPATALVLIVDAQGREAMSDPVGFPVPAPPELPLALTEVLANPAGDETRQEFVELRNLGPAPVSVTGLFIEDEAGRDPLPAFALDPGAFALIVASGYVPDDPADVAPREGTLLLRVSGRIGRDGLRQQGEAVRLLAGDGTVVSSYGGFVDTSRAVWNGRSVHRQPDPGACDHPQAWTTAPLPPTPGW